MKIRISFVPNSSSSSFIVIFPRRPRSIKEVFKFLFGKSDPESYIGDDKTVTYMEAAQTVFRDLKAVKVTYDKLMDLFDYRYHYMPHCLYGGFYQRSKVYWGSDPELVDQIRKTTIASEKKEEQYRKQLNTLLAKHIKPVPYAWAESKNEKGKPRYTKKQVKDFNAYQIEEKKFKETNEEYIKIQKESYDSRDKEWKALRKLETELAQKDLKLFQEGTKGKFVAIFKYSDNEGNVNSNMEHGGVFDRIEHIRISHH